MANISKIKVAQNTYDIKDASAMTMTVTEETLELSFTPNGDDTFTPNGNDSFTANTPTAVTLPTSGSGTVKVQ